jgi:hypothetical protein
MRALLRHTVHAARVARASAAVSPLAYHAALVLCAKVTALLAHGARHLY